MTSLKNMYEDDLYREAREAIDKRILNEHIEAFFQRWAPEDRNGIGLFGRDLHNLTRAIYQDAAIPYQRMLNDALKIMPTTIIPFPKINK